MLVFIHGFNNRFDDAVFRFAQIVHDSNAPVVPILFTWPSRGSVLAYGYDRESTAYSRNALESLLKAISRDPAVGEISILAHSMGNSLALETLRQMAIRDGRVTPKIRNVLLAAPDVDVDLAREAIVDMGPRANRPAFTLFVSQDDRALAVSRRVWGSEARLGAINPDQEPYRTQLEQANVTVLDLTKLKAGDALNHGKFAESPEVVQLIGKRLAEGQTVTDSRVGLGDRIIQVTAGAATAVGTAAGLAISAPVAVVDPRTRAVSRWPRGGTGPIRFRCGSPLRQVSPEGNMVRGKTRGHRSISVPAVTIGPKRDDVMPWILRLIARTALGLAVVLASVWCALALWYRLPVPEGLRAAIALLFLLLGVATIAASFSRYRLAALVAFAMAVCSTAVWWSTIRPPDHADWAPDVARQVTGSVEGNRLTLTNVRDFEWHDGQDATERWVTRSYDLDKLRTLDLFMSYWAGPEMAHVILSFGFEGDAYLAWSIEVRRTRGGEFSPIADLFKSNPLIIVAADERDVVRVRSNLRGEDVQLYRLNASPEAARRLLLEYVSDANELAIRPQFYNSLTTNCTTTAVKMMRAVGAAIPFDWRLIVNGYLPDYAYARGALDSQVSLPALKESAHIDARARLADGSPRFSQLIRVDVPSPRDMASANSRELE